VVSPIFSTSSGNELLIALISAGGPSGTTVTGLTGGGLNWVLANRSNSQPGTAEVWRAYATSPVSNASVTATLSSAAFASITVMSFTGADPSGASGSGAIGALVTNAGASGAPAATVMTTRNGSRVFEAVTDTAAVNPVPGSAQNLIHQYMSPAGSAYWAQQATGIISAAGTSISLSDSAPSTGSYNLAAVEILPVTTCVVGLAPQTRAFPAGGGSTTVVVANGSGCNWGVTTDSPSWVMLSGNAGTGNGSFTLTVAANLSSARLATISVGNQSFKIMQGGLPWIQSFNNLLPADGEFDYLSLLSQYGVTGGCASQTLLCPSPSITRGQVAAFVDAAFNAATGNNGTYSRTPYYQDVPASGSQDSVYFPFVQRMGDLGIGSGCSTTPSLFCPETSITQGEMAAFMIGAWMQVNNIASFTYSQIPYFSDVPATDPYFSYVQKMMDMGFWTGCSATQYCESGPVTLDSLAPMILRSVLGAP